MQQPQPLQHIKPFDFAALIQSVDRIERSKEQKLWDETSAQMRQLLWNLSGNNQVELNGYFKSQWLMLPNDCKARIRAAIHEMYRFVKACESVGGV